MHEYDRITDEVLCALGAAVGEDNLVLFEPMSAHTTFKIGGPADVMLTPRDKESVVRALDTCAIAGVPVTVVGNGSDLLVGDRGIRGVVILLRENYAAIDVAGTRIHAQAGALLRDVAACRGGSGALRPGAPVGHSGDGWRSLPYERGAPTMPARPMF